MVPAKALVTALQEALGDVFRHGSRSLLRGLLHRSLPALDGVVELSGLEGPVEVLRDRFGVPQVFAGNERDLFFAQGYIHAQDRFFQMELGRRAGQGRLSELIGGSALEFDRLSRSIGFGRVAATSEKNGPPQTLEILESYSAGVNACLSAGPLPPELRLLRLGEPTRGLDNQVHAGVLPGDGRRLALGEDLDRPVVDAQLAVAGLDAAGEAAVVAVVPEQVSVCGEIGNVVDRRDLQRVRMALQHRTQGLPPDPAEPVNPDLNRHFDPLPRYRE